MCYECLTWGERSCISLLVIYPEEKQVSLQNELRSGSLKNTLKAIREWQRECLLQRSVTLPEGSVSDLPAELPLPAAFALSQKQYRYERLSDWETGKKKGH